jgi:hypothetical protein
MPHLYSQVGPTFSDNWRRHAVTIKIAAVLVASPVQKGYALCEIYLRLCFLLLDTSPPMPSTLWSTCFEPLAAAEAAALGRSKPLSSLGLAARTGAGVALLGHGRLAAAAAVGALLVGACH